MGKAVGIGGIFMKYNDEKAMKAWFETALGLTPNDYGVLFAFNGVPDSKRGFLQLGTFAATTKYFGNPAQQYMINFRVTDLVGLEKHLRELGTVICDSIETYDFGSFLHIEDPEGNRIELWEPIDSDSESKEVFVDMR